MAQVVRRPSMPWSSGFLPASTVVVAFLFSASALAQTPSASATLIPPSAPVPVPEAQNDLEPLEGLVGGPAVFPTDLNVEKSSASSFASWTCEGYAASPEPWLTANAELRLVLDGNVLVAANYSANYWGSTYQVGADVSPAAYTRTISCEINVTVPDCPGCGTASGSDSELIPAACGDERDNLIEEYRAGQVNWNPSCNDFAQHGPSGGHFGWNELNQPEDNTHVPWGIVRVSLWSGLENTRTNYNRGAIRISSGYRCPHVNGQIPGAAYQSRHMFGDAADMFSIVHPWTLAEWELLRQAARDAGSTWQSDWDDYTDRHLHADWR